MTSTTKPTTRKAGRPPTFKPGEFGEFLERSILMEIDQEIAKLQAARAAIIRAARNSDRASSARRS